MTKLSIRPYTFIIRGGFNYKLALYFTGMFVCDDISNAIDVSSKCDFRADCVDGSDERDCGRF